MEYEVASGKAIPNLGERHCEIDAQGYENSIIMHFQLADVHRPLLSLSKAADIGFRSYLDAEGWLEDMETGEVLPIERMGDLEVMQLCILGVQSEVSDSSTPFVGRG